MPALRPRRLAASARGRAHDSSSSYRQTLSENTSPFVKPSHALSAQQPHAKARSTSTALTATPTRRPLSERNVVPQVFIPSPVNGSQPGAPITSSLAAARRPTSTQQRSRTTTSERQQSATDPVAPLDVVVPRRTRSAAIAAAAAVRPDAVNSSNAPAAAPSRKKPVRRSSPSTSHVSVQIPALKQRRGTARSPRRSSSADQVDAAARDFAVEQKQQQPAEEQPDAASSRAAIPDSDDLEYVDPAVLLLPAASAPHGQQHQMTLAAEHTASRLPKDSAPSSPVSGHTSSDKENRPPPPKGPSGDAVQLGGHVIARRRMLPAMAAVPSSSMPQHSTPIAARTAQRRALQPDSSALPSSQAADLRAAATLDDLFPISSDGLASRSVSISPATRQLMLQRQASDQESQLARSQRQGYSRAEEWAQQQRLTSMSSREQEEEDEAEIVKLVKSSPPPLLVAATTSMADDLDSRLGLPSVEAESRDDDGEEDDDPFGFFECQAKLKARRTAERLVQRIERRNQPLPSGGGEAVAEAENERQQAAGESREVDDTELARTVFRSSSPPAEGEARDHERLARKGHGAKTATATAVSPRTEVAFDGAEEPEVRRAASKRAALLEKSVLPVAVDDSLEHEIGRTTRTRNTRKDEPAHDFRIALGAPRDSSPLSSALSSPPPSPRRPVAKAASAVATTSKPRSYRRGSQPFVVIPGIPLKRTEVKEREMLERLARRSSSSSTSSSLSPDNTGKSKRKQPLKMDDLVALLPRRKANGLNGKKTRNSEDQEEEEEGKDDYQVAPPKGKSIVRRGRKTAATTGVRSGKNVKASTTTKDRTTSTSMWKRRRAAATPENDEGEEIPLLSSASFVDERTRPTLRTASKRPGASWRNAVGSSETKSSDSERTKRIKRYKKLDEYSMELELVL